MAWRNLSYKTLEKLKPFIMFSLCVMCKIHEAKLGRQTFEKDFTKKCNRYNSFYWTNINSFVEETMALYDSMN